jgi:hypothetical protein
MRRSRVAGGDVTVAVSLGWMRALTIAAGKAVEVGNTIGQPTRVIGGGVPGWMGREGRHSGADFGGGAQSNGAEFGGADFGGGRVPGGGVAGGARESGGSAGRGRYCGGDSAWA